jgi:hypothetical protein
MTETWNYGEAAQPSGFPWPPPEEGGVMAAFGETWKSATFDPASFFGRLPPRASVGPAILYYLVIGILVAGVSLFWDATGVFTSAAGDEAVAAELGFGTLNPVVGFMLSPLALLVGLALAAGITHLMLLMLGGARNGFATTVSVFCFSYSPAIFGVVPILGTLIGTLWMVVLSIIGLREAHATDGWKAALAVLLPFALLLALVVFAVLMMAAAGVMLLAA